MRRNESRHLPTLSPVQRERTRRSREALVRDGLLTLPPGGSGVPQYIEKSWRRCVGEQVPVAPDHIDYREPDDVLPAVQGPADRDCRSAAATEPGSRAGRLPDRQESLTNIARHAHATAIRRRARAIWRSPCAAMARTFRADMMSVRNRSALGDDGG
jgi:hypothetical protein